MQSSKPLIIINILIIIIRLQSVQMKSDAGLMTLCREEKKRVGGVISSWQILFFNFYLVEFLNFNDEKYSLSESHVPSASAILNNFIGIALNTHPAQRTASVQDPLVI